jgi:DNA-binding MarR family transcriptional regulator
VGYLVRKAYSRLFQSFTEALKDLGLAPGQYNALLLIGLNPGLSQMALADASGIDRTTMVPITERFAKAGWVRRTRRTEDRRVYSLRLTPSGEAVLRSAQPLIEAHEKELVAALRPAERSMLRALLARIADIETTKPVEAVEFGPLPAMVGYQLKRAYSYLFRTFMSAFKHLQLAPGQYSALVLISLNPGLSQLDLAEAAGLDGSTLVPITDRFVKLGWIRRVRRKSDRRVYALRITPAGQAVLDEARPIIAARERHLASVLKPDERSCLIDMLSRITDEQPASHPARIKSA